ncbi:co-chaperone YbbN [Methanococcoides methylutens]|uniref:Putative thiol:disulfide oxidoreductase involved in cytochrome C-type biogenesis n=1 Tax=Methanococcoides methylutens MM1 TaxID=1434104 RepID=A0A0E3SPM0_METMT|nr:thioredoxin family protein [Methanococcoides methylutens]AKB84551.1 Putative thiol:disulfide oxidoreductase involved in cytochrome C-type biogenesis [Methanococcoides methylutens MM1]
MRAKIFFLVIVVAAAVLTAGCVSDVTPVDNADLTVSSERAAILVTDQQQIDDALEDGPVLLKIGAEWCPPCRQLDPVIDELALDYEGRASVMYIDTEISPELGARFNVYSIPDTTVIVDIEDDDYVFMRYDGIREQNRDRARIIGYMEKGTFETILDHAIEGRQSTSED